MHAKITSPGLYPEITAAEYFNGLTPTRALTNSGIKTLINETPADYIGKEDTDNHAKRLGDVTHQLALGNGVGYEISPWDEYRSDASKAWKAAVIEAGKTPIKQKDFDAAAAMAKIIMERIGRALGGAEYQTEVPFYWQEPTAGGTVWCSGMLDVWCPSLGIAIDPKITKYLHGDKLRSHIANMGWHTQNAWYRRGLSKIMPELGGKVRFRNLFISPDKPHTSRLVDISEGWRTGAEQDCLRAVAIFGRCMATSEWPGYPEEEILDEPSWKQNERIMREMMDEDEGGGE